MAASADAAPGVRTPSAEAVRAAHAHLLQDRRIQFDFAVMPKPPPPPQEPEWLKALGRFISQIIEWAMPALKVLFWVGVAAIVALLVFLILREVLGVRFSRRRRANARVQPVDWRPEAWKAKALLEDADRLAEEGRYDEAVHLILYRSIDDIEGRRPRLVRPALTARDIAALEGVPGAARAAFAQIARVVEASFFGGRDVDRAAFAACRKAYEDFAFPEVWA
ncbi:MAG TPA: DUF4129 domain-containing protein [Caulobacteraceae bacterium]